VEEAQALKLTDASTKVFDFSLQRAINKELNNNRPRTEWGEANNVTSASPLRLSLARRDRGDPLSYIMVYLEAGSWVHSCHRDHMRPTPELSRAKSEVRPNSTAARRNHSRSSKQRHSCGHNNPS